VLATRDFKTTRAYIDLAGEMFREKAERLEPTERRRSRTYRAVGYTTAPVLKTGWATGPMPLRDEPSAQQG
jgi:hypothetical protein